MSKGPVMTMRLAPQRAASLEAAALLLLPAPSLLVLPNVGFKTTKIVQLAVLIMALMIVFLTITLGSSSCDGCDSCDCNRRGHF